MRSLIFLVLFFVVACTETIRPDQEKHGNEMSDKEDVKEKTFGEHIIVVNDYGAKTQKIKPAEEFPESMRFFDVKMIADGKEAVIKVPVKEIRIRPQDKDGNLVDMAKATIVSIQYLDDSGNVLQSTTMQK